jgi:hypothetical protein
MNLQDTRYAKHALVQEMMDTVKIVKSFDSNQTKEVASQIRSVGRLLLTGEGSSRIFPSKHALMQARRNHWPLVLHSEAGRQAQDGGRLLEREVPGKQMGEHHQALPGPCIQRDRLVGIHPGGVLRPLEK